MFASTCADCAAAHAGDFLMSAALSQQLSSEAGFQQLQEQTAGGTAVVIPAFEINSSVIEKAQNLTQSEGLALGAQLALQVAAGSKADLGEGLSQGWLGSFRQWKYSKGHTATDFRRCAPFPFSAVAQ